MAKKKEKPTGSTGLTPVRYLRQSTLIPPSRLPGSVVIIGVGGLGSHVAERIEKMGCPKLYLWDPDKVEEHNLGSQNFPQDSVGRYKVEAMCELLNQLAESTEECYAQEFDGTIPENSVVVNLVDTMDERIKIWNDHILYNPNVLLYIEARMAGMFGYIYAVQPCDPTYIEEYQKTLYSSKEAMDIPCTARGVDFNCAGIATWIARIIAGYAMEEKIPFEVVVDYQNYTTLPRNLS